MTPTILIAGATGNTGRSVVETLSRFLGNSDVSPDTRILALTRSIDSSAAQHLASLPSVTVIEKNWVDINASWLREQNVIKAFIASHNGPSQFAEESTFHQAALMAGVQYVVRISTTAANVRPDFEAYYPRTHWAIETMLSSPEFRELKWTSLQPNIFFSAHLYSAVEFVKEYRQTKKQGILKLIADKDAPVGAIDPDDIVMEEAIGEPVDNVEYRDVSLVDAMVLATKESKNVISSIKAAPVTLWEGKCPASTTSKEVIEIAAPNRSVIDAWKALLSAN
ncbi:hypothetical protein CTAM01_11277 [Colletotrichum tamarilloi]|uniref:NmrA-like domain-containing protein n=1 Tax=Colletotrichum tamarilloi TaxID=1209934 RepID=A0ABQ9QY91_9PEZI|nr:uncharacterized protein CTAM01_11277 [Colletotrichum tamarilloi]KAK1489128.1 hypothetical protein CTAM01_11277 [Colletotrichum tamarilloi]